MCCRHGGRGTCGMWNTRTCFLSACGACFCMRWLGVSSDTCCIWRNNPCRGFCLWHPENVQGGVVPHPGYKGGMTPEPGFTAGDCCAVVTNDLQAEFIYEHVEGAKAVASTRVGSVVIHNDIGVLRGPNKKLHE